MARYIDVSNYQGSHFPFKNAKRAGFDGVWIKATEGVSYESPTLEAQVFGARSAGLRVGFYHFARPDHNHPVDEAIFFANRVRKYGIRRRDLRPVLDLEHGTAQPQYVAWARSWNQQVKQILGVGPLFYSYPDYIKNLKANTPIGYGLWIASYGSNDGKRHPVSVPFPWKTYAAHQYTSSGHIRGWTGNLDFSYVNPLYKARVLANPVKGLI